MKKSKRTLARAIVAVIVVVIIIIIVVPVLIWKFAPQKSSGRRAGLCAEGPTRLAVFTIANS